MMASRSRPIRSRLSSSRSHSLPRLIAVVAIGFVVVSALIVASLRFINPPTTAFIAGYERERGADKPRNLVVQKWKPLASLGANIATAVIASEDQKFFTHWGFDMDAVSEAVEGNLDGTTRRGASTITQQLAKNLFLWKGRSFIRKGFEAYLTLLLEALLPKRRILELYLNVAEFGPGIYGAEAGAQVYFGKPAAQLTMREAALMAAVLPNPRHRSPAKPSGLVETRADWIEEQVGTSGASR